MMKMIVVYAVLTFVVGLIMIAIKRSDWQAKTKAIKTAAFVVSSAVIALLILSIITILF